jgi:hypothetical protein
VSDVAGKLRTILPSIVILLLFFGFTKFTLSAVPVLNVSVDSNAMPDSLKSIDNAECFILLLVSIVTIILNFRRNGILIKPAAVDKNSIFSAGSITSG